MAYVLYIAELEKDLPFFWEERQRLYGACYGAGALLMLMASAIWLTLGHNQGVTGTGSL